MMLLKRRRFLARRVWADNARQLGLEWHSFAKFLLSLLVVLLALAVYPHIPLRQGVIGFCIGSALMATTLGIARFDDPIVRGHQAEQRTAEVMEARGWPVVNGLSFYDGDIDHVVVTPSGVLGVSTKYRFRQIDRKRMTAQRWRDLASAQHAGHRVRNLLESKTFAVDVPTMGVLVVWGDGAPTLAEGYKCVDGVYVIDGRRPECWSHLFNAPLVNKTIRAQLVDTLREYQRSQDQDAAAKGEAPLRKICWREFRTGLGEANSRRRAQREMKATRRRRHDVRRRRVAVADATTDSS